MSLKKFEKFNNDDEITEIPNDDLEGYELDPSSKYPYEIWTQKKKQVEVYTEEDQLKDHILYFTQKYIEKFGKDRLKEVLDEIYND